MVVGDDALYLGRENMHRDLRTINASNLYIDGIDNRLSTHEGHSITLLHHSSPPQ